MNEKATKIALVIVAMVLFVTIIFIAGCSTQKSADAVIQTSLNARQPADKLVESPTGFTMNEVKAHCVQSDCWMVIRGKVYDVTDFVSSHPGGKSILMGCGTDATTYFDTKGNRGQPHSASANQLLDQYYIGDLIVGT